MLNQFKIDNKLKARMTNANNLYLRTIEAALSQKQKLYKATNHESLLRTYTHERINVRISKPK